MGELMVSVLGEVPLATAQQVGRSVVRATKRKHSDQPNESIRRTPPGDRAAGLWPRRAVPSSYPRRDRSRTLPAGAPAQVLPDFADLVEKYGPAVVNINTRTRAARQQGGLPGLDENDPFYEFFRRFMPDQQRPPGAAHPRGTRNAPPDARQGAAAPVRPGLRASSSPQDGYIVTNAHVVENADEITVRFTDKRELTAKVIGADTRSDVAVIKVDATGLPVVKIADASASCAWANG